MLEKQTSYRQYDPYTWLPTVEKLWEDEQTLKQCAQKEECFLISIRLDTGMDESEEGFEETLCALHAMTTWIKKKNYARCTLYKAEQGLCLCLRRSTEARAAQIVDELVKRFEYPWVWRRNAQPLKLYRRASITLLHWGLETHMEEIRLRVSPGKHKKAIENKAVPLHSPTLAPPEERAICKAIKQCVFNTMEGFEARFRPVVEAQSERWMALEVLCTWTMPGYGALPSAEFLPLARAVGLENAISEWLLERAICCVKQCAFDQNEDFFLIMPASVAQLRCGTFIKSIGRLLNQYHFPGSMLALGIGQERLGLEGLPPEVVVWMNALRIRVIMDDFNASDARLGGVGELNLRALRPHAGLLKGIETSAKVQHYYYVMSEIAHRKLLPLIAQGVRNAKQMKALARSGVDLLQGEYFSSPLTQGHLEAQTHRFQRAKPQSEKKPGLLAVFSEKARKEEDMQTRDMERHEERKRAHHILQTLDEAQVGMFVSDMDTDEVIWHNKACKTLYGIEEMAQAARCHEVFREGAQHCTFWRKEKLLSENVSEKVALECYDAVMDKTLLINNIAMRWMDGRPAQLSLAIDVTSQRKNARKWAEMATKDMLTGANSRYALMELLQDYLAEACAGTRRFSIAYVDVDGLKYYNDHLGHSEGDRLLRNTVESIRRTVRNSDIIGRIGGDEFVVLFPECERKVAHRRMENARNTLRREHDMTFSYGVAEVKELASCDSEQAEALLTLADERMRAHKKAHAPKEYQRAEKRKKPSEAETQMPQA